VQSTPQEIPAGALYTVPLPEPALLTVNGKFVAVQTLGVLVQM
jgi:hypothetical protein